MGNYCCVEESQNNASKTKKVLAQDVSLRQRKNRISENWKPEQDKELLTLIKKKNSMNSSSDFPNIQNFTVVGELGRGGQGQVFQICFENSMKRSLETSFTNEQSPLAIKRISKRRNLQKKNSIKLGSQLLLQNKCPFIMEGLSTFESDQYVYEVMDVADGGDLLTFLQTTTGKGDAFRKLGEEGIKMILAGVVQGLSYLHQQDYIYCDLKIENVLVKEDGFPRLTDLELIVKSPWIYSSTFQGTLTSVAPQIFTSEKVDKAIDLWALGILLYRLVYQQAPFQPEEITDDGFAQMAKSKDGKYGLKRKKVSPQLHNLINSLLKLSPQKRIGYKSISQIKNHNFFNGFDWKSYLSKTIKNPISEIVQKYSNRVRNKKRKNSLPLNTMGFSSLYSDGVNEDQAIRTSPNLC